MYTSVVGRKFLNAYNKAYGKSYSPEEFFREVFIPLFFDHPKYLMTAGNAPLENPKISWGDMMLGKKPYEDALKRQDRIEKTMKRILEEKPDASIARGYPATEGSSPTLSQVTNMEIQSSSDDSMLSWVGDALSIGVSGGITILFDDESVLLDLFKGWGYYREYVNTHPMMKGNQINTWNGVWLAYYYGPHYNERMPVNSEKISKDASGIMSLSTTSWISVLSGMVNREKRDTMTGYLYSIGQTNSTFGFIPFSLNEIRRPFQLYKKLFGEQALVRDHAKMELLFGGGVGLHAVCRRGAIGVRSMEPKGLHEYMVTSSKRKNIKKPESEDDTITYNIYLTWIMAVLNNADLWNQTEAIIQELISYQNDAAKLRANRKNNVEKLLESRTLDLFLKNLIPLIQDTKADGKDTKIYQDLIELLNIMPRENYSYFNTLLGLRFALLN